MFVGATIGAAVGIVVLRRSRGSCGNTSNQYDCGNNSNHKTHNKKHVCKVGDIQGTCNNEPTTMTTSKQHRVRGRGPSIPVQSPRLIGRKDLLLTHYNEPDHWSRVVMPPTAPAFVGVLQVTDDIGERRTVLVLVHNAAGYATVVALASRDKQQAAAGACLNSVPSQREMEAVTLAASQVAAAFMRLGMWPQLMLLGNNSHGFDAEAGALHLGNTKEPSVPHVHVIGRGDPSHAYAGGVPLRGLQPYEVVVPREWGAMWGAKWELPAVATALAQSLECVELHPSVELVEKRVQM